jgi:hypothetical protein
MVVYRILTYEYDLPLGRLIDRHMRDLDNAYSLEITDNGVLLKVRGEHPERAAAHALSQILGHDVRCFALAEFTDALPLSLSEKQEILRDAIEAAQRREEPAVLMKKLLDYLSERNTVCLEGFLRFRMQEFLMLWEVAVERAAAKVLMQKEYGELLETLKRFAETRRARVGSLSVCIHPDGTITLSDDGDVRIEYVDCTPDGILQLLVNMSPLKLTVYDLSGDEKNRLTEAIMAVFGNRVKLYR